MNYRLGDCPSIGSSNGQASPQHPASCREFPPAGEGASSPLLRLGVGGTRVGTTWRGAVPAHLHKRVLRCGGERRSSPSSLALWAKSSLRSFVRCLCLQCSWRQHSSPGISGHLFVTSLTNCISNFLSAFLILISYFSSYESAFQGWNYFSEGFFV